MSRDFSPRDCWLANKQFDGLYLSNIKITIGDKVEYMFTDEELKDRQKYKYIAILGTDVYTPIRQYLSEKDFDIFNNQLKQLIEADFEKHDTTQFPKEITNWYFNRHNHYYHEPNDAELLEYIRNFYEPCKTNSII